MYSKILFLLFIWLCYFMHNSMDAYYVTITPLTNKINSSPENLYLNKMKDYGNSFNFTYKTNSNIYCNRSNSIILNNNKVGTSNIYNCYYKESPSSEYYKIPLYSVIQCLKNKCRIKFTDNIIMKCTPKNICDQLGNNFEKIRSFIFY